MNSVGWGIYGAMRHLFHGTGHLIILHSDAAPTVAKTAIIRPAHRDMPHVDDHDDDGPLSLEQALQHGDLSLRFADGRRLRVHSTILFLASSVLRKLFQDLRSSEGIAAKRPRTDEGATSREGEDSLPVSVSLWQLSMQHRCMLTHKLAG